MPIPSRSRSSTSIASAAGRRLPVLVSNGVREWAALLPLHSSTIRQPRRLLTPDCSTTFQNQEYKSHTSCISEAEKYQGKLYKGKNSAAPSAPSSNATPAESPAPSEAGAPTIHPSRLNQLQDTRPFDNDAPQGRGFSRGRGGFAARGRGAYGGRPARTFHPTGQNLVSAEGQMRSWGSTPVASDSETTATTAPATPASGGAGEEMKKRKKKGDKGGTGSKANSSRLKHETTESEPASKKRKFAESPAPTTAPTTAPATATATAGVPPSDKALKRLRKHMSKLESKSSASIPLSQWLEKVAQGKDKTVDQTDILQGVQVSFVDGAWKLSA